MTGVENIYLYNFSKSIDWGSHWGASHKDTWAGCKIVLYIYLRKVLPTVTSQNHQTLFVKWFCFSIPYEFFFILETLSELLTGCHATPLVTRCCFLITNIIHGTPFHVNGHQMICHKCYRFERESCLPSGIFYHTLLPAVQGFAGANSSAPKSAGLLVLVSQSQSKCLFESHRNPQT